MYARVLVPNHTTPKCNVESVQKSHFFQSPKEVFWVEFAMYIPCTTCLHILLAHSCLYYNLLSLRCTVLQMLFCYSFFYLCSYFLFHFFPYLYLCIFSCVCVPYNCTVHGAAVTYISLLVIFCIIVYDYKYTGKL